MTKKVLFLAALGVAACASSKPIPHAPDAVVAATQAPSEPGASLPPVCEWREHEYFDQVTVNTCNAYAAISVRTLSMGPGTCTLELRASSGERRSINALPAVWSGWISVVEHTGVVSRSITNVVHCDTGVRTQVRYSAPKP